MDNQKYKDATIEFLGEDNLKEMKLMGEEQLIFVWESALYGRWGMQVRNYLRNKFPEIEEIFGNNYRKIEDWSWELINEILKEYEPENEKELLQKRK